MKYHKIRFRKKTVVAVVTPNNKPPVNQDLIEPGWETECTLRPHVIDNNGTFIEVADIQLSGGETFIAVPYRNFEFV